MTDIKDIEKVVCDWEQIYRNKIDCSVNLFHSIVDNNDIANLVDKYNPAVILCEWEQVYRNEIPRSEKLFHSIINDNGIINLADKYISVLEPSIWVEKWYKYFLEDERKHKEDGHNFNIFYLFRDEFGINVHETMHSRLLKFLLNSHASHGQENKFLIEFLKLIQIERPTEGIWNITAEKGRIDVLLKRNEPHSVIIIENKSNWAGDQPNQLYRYWYYFIYEKTKRKDEDFYTKNENKYQIIYLAPNSNKLSSEQTITKPKDLDNNLPDKMPIKIKNLYFNDFIQVWLENCIKYLSIEKKENYRIREYIEQYKMLCNKL